MLSVKVYNQAGQEAGQTELEPKVFGLKLNPGLIEQAIVTILHNRRQPIAHTKTRGEVRGGGKKPWKQKGTGRARQGSIRSPQWKGGGVIFGPRKNRHFNIKMNVSAKRQAMLMSLSDKAHNKKIVVIDKVEFAKPRTKDFAALLKKLPLGKQTLVVLPGQETNILKSGRNIPKVTFIRADSLNTYDIVRHESLLIMKAALPVISKTYLK